MHKFKITNKPFVDIACANVNHIVEMHSTLRAVYYNGNNAILPRLSF